MTDTIDRGYASPSGDLPGLLTRTVTTARHETWTGFTTELQDIARQAFPKLQAHSNPIRINVRNWSEPELAFLIGEYSRFATAAVHMLFDAQIRLHSGELSLELQRNIGEELGSQSGGIPHLELMRSGYRSELGLDTDAVEATALTREFIDRLSAVFCSANRSFLAGALLAFETVAVDEFRVVAAMIYRFGELRAVTLAPESLTARYIAGHVSLTADDDGNDPEMEHYLGMLNAVGASVEPSEYPEVARGFLAVCLELEAWWDALPTQARAAAIRSIVAQPRDALHSARCKPLRAPDA